MCCNEMGEDVCLCRFWQSVLLESSSVTGELLKCRLDVYESWKSAGSVPVPVNYLVYVLCADSKILSWK